VGSTSAGDKKMTRVKMDAPSFDALRIALEDSDARVRIEDLVRVRLPWNERFPGSFDPLERSHGVG